MNDHAVNHESERNAYNAAFYELGLKWHWDSSTYSQLFEKTTDAAQGIHHYLQTRHPHLLKAYDASFLARAIEEKKARKAGNAAAGSAQAKHFDWAQTTGLEIGT